MTLHEVERNLMLLSLITKNYSLAEAKRLAGKPITIYDQQYGDIAGVFMRTAAEGRKIIGLNAGSTWATKRWSAEYYAKLAEILHNRGYALAIFGGPSDHEAVDKLKSLINMEYFDYADKVPFHQIPTLIKNIDLLITNDSAPLHIAVSQGTPVVAIFGATVPTLGFAPYDDVSVVCENVGLYCRPCGLHGGSSCPERHYRCMMEITPEQVAEAAMGILS
jgi:heptosyltransferase-2